jgi:hypothetical protein
MILSAPKKGLVVFECRALFGKGRGDDFNATNLQLLEMCRTNGYEIVLAVDETCDTPRVASVTGAKVETMPQEFNHNTLKAIPFKLGFSEKDTLFVCGDAMQTMLKETAITVCVADVKKPPALVNVDMNDAESIDSRKSYIAVKSGLKRFLQKVDHV